MLTYVTNKPVRADKYSVIPLSQSASHWCINDKFIDAIIWTESKGQIKAKSGKGALGIAQFMPDTWKWLWRYVIKQPEYASLKYCFDKEKSIYACKTYIGWLCERIKKHFPDSNNHTALVLAGYNAGLGSVLKHRDIPPFQETKTYIERVRTTYEMLTRTNK